MGQLKTYGVEKLGHRQLITVAALAIATHPTEDPQALANYLRWRAAELELCQARAAVTRRTRAHREARGTSRVRVEEALRLAIAREGRAAQAEAEARARVGAAPGGREVCS